MSDKPKITKPMCPGCGEVPADDRQEARPNLCRWCGHNHDTGQPAGFVSASDPFAALDADFADPSPTEREVSSERVSGELRDAIAAIIAGNVDESRFYNAPAFQRAATEVILALRSSVKTVGVKKLEWRNLALPVQGRAGRTPFGDYRIGPRDEGRGWYAFLEGQSHMGPFASEDAAIAAAQADYERRIRSALEATTPQEAPSEVTEEMVERLFVEMDRRMGLQKHIHQEPNPDWLPVDDTQIGVEFAVEFITAALKGDRP